MAARVHRHGRRSQSGGPPDGGSRAGQHRRQRRSAAQRAGPVQPHARAAKCASKAKAIRSRFFRSPACALPPAVARPGGSAFALVGREAEWQQLSTAVQQLQSGRGQIVSIIGEAGLGKSRLAAELRADLRRRAQPRPDRQVRWFEGRCVSFYESVSYRPMQELIGQIIGLQSDDDIAEAWSKLRTAVETWPSAENAQPPCHIWRISGAAVVRCDAREGALSQRRGFAAAHLHRHSHVDRRAGQDCRPWCLMLDDIHWMDQASLDLLDYLAVADRIRLRSCGCCCIAPSAARAAGTFAKKPRANFRTAPPRWTLDRLSLAETQQLLDEFDSPDVSGR